MTPTQTPWTTEAGCESPIGLAMRLYQDGWMQLLGLQQAWWASLGEWQQQLLAGNWPPQGPWLTWPALHDGSEQLA